MAITIESGIPAPADANAFTNLGISAAMHAVKPGESFLLLSRDITYASRIIHREKKRRPGSMFTSRTVPGGVRIWCLADPRYDLLS